MNNDKMINIDKVVDKIGLKERMQYDKIDVYVDAQNKNNVWGIVYYTEDQRKKRISREKIVHFNNYNEMIAFVKEHFNGYELEHQVDYLKRQIFIHNVDYNHISYYLYDGKPNLNYIEVEYKEYVNDGFHIRKKTLPKEYNDMLVEILKTNKNIAKNAKLNWDLYQVVDVLAKKEKYEPDKEPRISRQEKRIKREENKIPMPTKRNHRIRNLAIVATVISLSAVVGNCVLEKSMEYKREVVTQDNASLFGKDALISQNKEKASITIDNLFKGNYHEVSQDDLKMALEFIKDVGWSNFDNNNSSTFFAYQDFFSTKFYQDNNYTTQDAIMIDKILKQIEELYSNCFKRVGNELIFNQKSAEKYIDYVASLTFMYDASVDSSGSSQVVIPSRITSPQYATQKEIMAYNKCPSILKYIVLNQLKSVISNTNYEVKDQPSNYFGGLDKHSLQEHIAKKIDNIGILLRNQCSDNIKKGI